MCACQTAPRKWDASQLNTQQAMTERIVVHSHGKHTGLSLQADRVNSQIPELQLRFPDVRYYEIGWGDAGFYQSEKITSRLTLRAVFWPTDTVMHVVGYDEDPEYYFRGSENKTLFLSLPALEQMVGFIASSFARNGEGDLIPTREGIYGDSQFYEAKGKYFLFNTCNKWTAKALSSGGIDIGVMYKITSGSVMRDL